MQVGLGLSLTIPRVGGFSPASLFAASEPGAWYDPSDLTTMFQDRAGTTPVTAPGQSVGLVLDKRLGLTPGPELVLNGDFSAGATGWNLQTGSSVVDGKLVLNSPALNVTSVYTVQIGKSYIWSFTVSDYVSGLVSFNFGGTTRAIVNGNGTYTGIAVAVISTASPRILNSNSPVASIDNISVREIPGFHMVANSDAARGTYNVDEAGRGFILFDGVDDGYATSTITPGTDKVQVFAGMRKLSDAAGAILVEHSAAVVSNAGSFGVFAPSVAASNYLFRSRGSAAQVDASYTNALVAAPITNVLTGLGDIAGDLATLRVNGTQVNQSTADQGTGNYLAYPLFIGRRGGSSQPFNGRLYSLIVRFGPNLTADQIAATEAWVNSKTGAY